MTADILDGYGAKLVLAIAVVSAALFLLYLVARMLGRRRASTPGRAAQGARRRLAVIETAAVDANRQLVLVRRDDVEHLILIGGPGDVLIESGIGRTAEMRPAVAKPVASPVATAARSEKPVSQQESILLASSSAEMGRGRPAAVTTQTAESPQSANTSVNSQTPPDPRRAETRRDFEDLLDDARGRVFGEPTEDRRVEPAADTGNREPEPRVERREPPSSFEAVLDAEIAGDLSGVNPGSGGRMPAREPAAPPQPPKAAPTVDAEMARLLGELSTKR